MTSFTTGEYRSEELSRRGLAGRASKPGPRVGVTHHLVAAAAWRGYTSPMDPSFDQMTTAERILYVQELWDRIAAEGEVVPLSEAQRAELRRRLADHEAHPEASIPWEVAREQVRRRR